MLTVKQLNININQKLPVWFKENWSERIVFGIPIGITDDLDKHITYVEIKGVLNNEKSFGGNTKCLSNALYLTEEDCIKAENLKRNKLVCEYKSSIKNINDLFKFPLEHPFGIEEYTNYEAIRAYKERAKELGIINI